MPIFRIVVFTKTPLRKTFKYRDVFQLVPYTDDFIPKVTRYVVDYPCFLEYNLPDERCDLKSQWDRDREIPILLTAFSIYRVFIYNFYASSWGVAYPTYSYDYVSHELSKSDFQELIHTPPVYNYSGFYYEDPKHILKSNSFSDAIGSNIMTLNKHYVSYLAFEQGRYDIRNDSAEITFSEETLACLDAYYAMDGDIRKKIFSAARLISDCIALDDYRHSLSFMAGVAALETLADLATSDEGQVVEDCHSCHHIAFSPYTCSKCGRPIWGVTKKVKNFLKEYVSRKDEDVKNYNAIYNIRSKITHTGDIFVADSIFDDDESRSLRESRLGYKLLEYARRGMIAFLLRS